MDVILEAFDTYIFDRAYATLLPLNNAYSVFEPISTIAAGLKNYGFENQSSTQAGETLLNGITSNGWQWKPASTWISFEPSQYAYQSTWDRDNIYRQIVSLYLLTW